METDFHLQISQHQARLKHENFTLSYNSYTTAKHFAATATFYLYTTASTIWGLLKLGLVVMVSYHYKTTCSQF